jgi:hypothetical protein
VNGGAPALVPILLVSPIATMQRAPGTMNLVN